MVFFHCLVWASWGLIWLSQRKISARSSKAVNHHNHHNHLLADFPHHIMVLFQQTRVFGQSPGASWTCPSHCWTPSRETRGTGSGTPWIGKVTGRWPKDEGGKSLANDHGSIPIDTSSTAQGGGGSFKNRKPIGEVGCCESGMAERSHWLTERWLELCLLEWLQWLQWSPHPQLLDVVWCTANCSCSCSVVEL